MNTESLQVRKDLYSLISSIRSNAASTNLVMLNDDPSDFTTDVVELMKKFRDITNSELITLTQEATKSFEVHQLKQKASIETLLNAQQKEGDKALNSIFAKIRMDNIKSKSRFRYFLEKLAKGTRDENLAPLNRVELKPLSDIVDDTDTDNLLIILFFCEANLKKLSKTKICDMSFEQYKNLELLSINYANIISELSSLIDKHRFYLNDNVNLIVSRDKSLYLYNDAILQEDINTKELLELASDLIPFKKTLDTDEITIDD
ncbi:hypothetical protein [Vibrio sp. D431a]|uniref:hypothetical protein n=1 Tax=Vibrio sp. D431a TaxID=2837388 RepID=UPI0025579F4A|nr:hypothetical protein [Vibrio sp. D431a]MDK9790634.1 hypothetical protein [Vibrio sp. D431a]